MHPGPVFSFVTLIEAVNTRPSLLTLHEIKLEINKHNVVFEKMFKCFNLEEIAKLSFENFEYFMNLNI